MCGKECVYGIVVKTQAVVEIVGSINNHSLGAGILGQNLMRHVNKVGLLLEPEVAAADVIDRAIVSSVCLQIFSKLAEHQSQQPALKAPRPFAGSISVLGELIAVH